MLIAKHISHQQPDGFDRPDNHCNTDTGTGMGENDLSPVKSWGQLRFNDLNDLTNQFLPTQTMHTIGATSLGKKHQIMPSPMKSILPQTPSPTHKSQWYFIYCRFVLRDIQTDALFLFSGLLFYVNVKSPNPKKLRGHHTAVPKPKPQKPNSRHQPQNPNLQTTIP